MKLALALALVVAALVTPSAAHAFSSVPGHADIKVTPIKNKAGCVTGCKVNFQVRNIGSAYSGAKFGRVGAYKAGVVGTIGNSDAGRHSTFEPEQAKFFTHVDVPTPDQNAVVPGHLTIDYAQHGVKSGDKVSIVSSWKYNPSNAPHVYGAVTQTSADNDFTAP